MRQICCGLVVVTLMGGCSYGPASLLSEASNAASQTICSGTFISGLAPDEAYRAALRPEPGMWAIDWALHYEVDHAHHEVRSTIAGAFASRAVFLEGRGCTLIRDGTLTQAIRTKPPTAALLPEIAGPELVVSGNAALRAAIDTAFEEPGEGVPRATRAVVVVHDGHVIATHPASGSLLRSTAIRWRNPSSMRSSASWSAKHASMCTHKRRHRNGAHRRQARRSRSTI